MHYVYVIWSESAKRKYIGSTSDLKKRLLCHNTGLVTSTKTFIPWKLIFYEAHSDKMLAILSEMFYKTAQGRRQLKKKLGLK
ncbi:GIY-YIG nuclease family protein [Patescibacteria group bacterium]|nr:GIY-YIG nuclease family protein [Patescibacteria group bacterium]MBU1907433.1 GIY-YIG nuclease family protein [Patescibacteria group bacterium]